MKLQDQYETDFYGWAMANASLLRERKLNALDFENLIEEIEDMSGSVKREFTNRLSILIAHILKWKFQPEMGGHSWRYTIRGQRNHLINLIQKNPSLKPKRSECLKEAYKYAVDMALSETKLKEGTFPKECPYTFDELMDEECLPEYDFKE